MKRDTQLDILKMALFLITLTGLLFGWSSQMTRFETVIPVSRALAASQGFDDPALQDMIECVAMCGELNFDDYVLPKYPDWPEYVAEHQNIYPYSILLDRYEAWYRNDGDLEDVLESLEFLMAVDDFRWRYNLSKNMDCW